MNTQELIQVGKDRIAQQEEQLGEHIKEAKKGIVQVNEIKHELKEQKELINKEMDDMERVDSRMKKLTKRFEKYVAEGDYPKYEVSKNKIFDLIFMTTSTE